MYSCEHAENVSELYKSNLEVKMTKCGIIHSFISKTDSDTLQDRFKLCFHLSIYVPELDLKKNFYHF